MVETHRLLDDETLKDLLARANPQRTNTVVIISQRVYEDVFRSGLDTGTICGEDFAFNIARAKKFFLTCLAACLRSRLGACG
ncbi:hypothetical protein SGLAM104S_04670 [Streptomyces glaucescens]